MLFAATGLLLLLVTVKLLQGRGMPTLSCFSARGRGPVVLATVCGRVHQQGWSDPLQHLLLIALAEDDCEKMTKETRAVLKAY